MRVLLINPPYRESVYTSPPLGLAYIASVLRADGHEPEILDCPALKFGYPEIARAVKETRPGLVGITAMTPVIKEAIETAKTVKSVADIPVVLGGPHASIMPGETLKAVKEIDFIARGEGEMIIRDLVRALEKGSGIDRVLGLSFRMGRRVRNNKDMPLIKDLDSLPFPARDLLPMGRYRQHIGEPNSFTTMITSRGCPYQCTYCLDPDTKIRTNRGVLSIKDVVDSREDFKVLTHRGRFKSVLRKFRHVHDGEILAIKPYYFGDDIRVTPNHRIFAFKREWIRNCPVAGKCTPYRFAVDCSNCSKRWHEQYKPSLIKAEELRNGDFIMVPVTKNLNNKKILKVSDILRNEVIRREGAYGAFSEGLAKKISELSERGLSTRRIAKELGISKSAAHNHVKHAGSVIEDNIEVEVENGHAKYKYGKNSIPNNIPLTKDFLRLVGYYLAEGSVSFHKNRPNSADVCFTFNENETEYIKDVINLIRKIFNLQAGRLDIKENKVTRLTVGSGILGRFFSALFGSDSLSARIPQEFLFLPPEIQGTLITGLFRGDGSKSKDSYVLNTASKHLKNGVQEILIRLGIVPSVHRARKWGRKRCKHDLYMISVLGPDLEKLQRIMGFEHEHILKRNRTYKLAFTFDDYILIPIKKIVKKSYKGFVYNLEVKDDHSYAANWMAVGNCTKAVFGHTYRARSPENMVKEIEEVLDRWKVKEVVFYDDTFTVNRKRVMDFCSLMVERGIRVKWKCEARVNLVDQELLSMMAKAGCYVIAYGVETGNPVLLKTIKKGFTKDQVRRAFRMTKNVGIETLGYFMIGIPGETRETIQQTLDFAIELDPDYAQFAVTTPYPKTELYEQAKRCRLLKESGWEKYSYFGDSATPVMRTKSLSTGELKEELSRITKAFYFRKGYVLKNVLKLRSVPALKRNVSGLRALLKWTR